MEKHSHSVQLSGQMSVKLKPRTNVHFGLLCSFDNDDWIRNLPFACSSSSRH